MNPQAPAPASAPNKPPSYWLPLIAFLSSVAGLILIGVISYQHQRDQMRSQVEAQLSVIGEFRIGQLKHWMSETRAATEFFSQGGQVADHFAAWTESGFQDQARVEKMLARVAGFQKLFGYHSISLFDTAGQYRLGDHPDPFMAEHRDDALQAIRQRSSVLVDFHQHGAGNPEPMLGMMVPLIQGNGRDSRLVGAVFIAIPANESLFPLLQQWPAHSLSGETVLTRTHHDQIEILYASRSKVAPQLRLMRQQPDLAAVRVMRGERGLLRATLDHRGNSVLAYGSPIAGTPWILVAKQDQSEVDAPVIRLALYSALGTGLLVLLSGFFYRHWWRGQTQRQSALLLGKDIERRVLERRYDTLSHYASDSILLIDEDGIILEANHRVEQMYGYPRSELLGQSLFLLMPSERQAEFYQRRSEAQRTTQQRYETEHQRRDGSRFPVEVSIHRIELHGVGHDHLTIHDISARIQSEQALQEREALYRGVIETSSDGFWIVDRQGRLQEVNDAYCRRSGFSREELLGMRISDLDANEQPEDNARRIVAIMRDGSALFETLHRARDGSLWQAEVNTSYSPASGGRFFAFIRDIEQRKQAEDELKRSTLRLLEAQRVAQLGNWEFDVLANHVTWSEQVYLIMGLDPAGATPEYQDHHRLIHPDDFPRFERDVSLAIADGIPFQHELRVVRPNGEIRHMWATGQAAKNPDGQVVRLLGTVQDITERRHAEARLEVATHYDGLTGLPNIRWLLERVRHAIEQVDDTHVAETQALLLLNIDRFAQLNESLGRAVGDQVLVALARRWSEALPEGCLLTRLDADQFAVLHSHYQETQKVIETAAGLMDSMRKPIEIAGVEKFILLTVSIGIALYPNDAVDATSLLHAAEDALRSAKADKGNQVRFFDRRHAQAAIDWFETENALRQALERDELFLVYQPQVDAASGRTIAVEALIRWRHNDQVVPPGRFIHVVEGTDLAEPVSRWVLRTACAQARQWLDRKRPLRVAVNIFSSHVISGHLLDDVSHALAESGLPAHLLELEVVESSLLNNPEAAALALREIKRLGVGLALDDFGTGYSSLGYLKHYPFDVLKIDQVFSRNVNRDPDDAAIVRSTIGLAHSLGMRVLAEGVETEPQLRFMARYGCDQIQGYLLSRPTTPQEVETQVMERRDLRPGSLANTSAQFQVLIVEDEPVQAELLAMLLQEAGYGTHAVADLDGAIAAMGRERIDLIICDHYLEHTTGVDVLAHLRRLFPDVPGIMVSGAVEQEVVVEAVNRGGIRAFLHKPVDGDVLLHTLKNLLAEATHE